MVTREAIVRFLEAIDGGNARVAQRREELRLALEARDALAIADEGVGQHLQRNISVQLRVAGAVDLTHTAGADGGYDFVGTKPRATGQTHRGAPEYHRTRLRP